MIALAVFAVLGAIAVPSFTNLQYDASRSNAVNGFIHTLFLARSEAMKRGEMISVCKSTDGNTCRNAASDWGAGWMAFVNTDRDDPPERDTDETVLAVHEGWHQGQISSNRAAFSFRPHIQGVVNGTLVFCDPRGSTSARAIIISHTGRPRVSQRDASNHPLRCPTG
jgi:type IV fimbrial biogenesis protein FimT